MYHHNNTDRKAQPSRFDFRLWKDYLDITQAFWLPAELHSTRRFVLLLFLTMLFVASALFFSLAAAVTITHSLAPDFVANNAPGLMQWLQEILHSRLLVVLLIGLLAPPAVFSRYRKKLRVFCRPWLLLALLLLLSFTVSGLNVVVSYVGRFFDTALAQKEQATYWRFLYIYASVFVVGTPIVVMYAYIRKKLGLYWRQWITEQFIEKYLKNRAYYAITGNRDLDNPDQRMAEDLNEFTGTSLGFLLIILGALIDLFAFTGILWSISRLLSMILLSYAVVGTLVTVFIGRRLVGLNYNQLKKEADFRYGLIHIRDNAEAIAFYRGEAGERRQIGKRFKEVLANWRVLIQWERNLDFFTTGYNYLVIILPSLIVAPLYFAGKASFGEITQASFAFAQVLAAFSIIVQNFTSISAFAAGINRVASFKEHLKAASGCKPVAADALEKRIQRGESPGFHLHHLTLYTPDGEQTLVSDLSLDLPPGDSLLIMGHSGVGKSSLLRAVAGLWQTGTGLIALPPARELLFLPQKPYLVLGSLRDQLQYPAGLPLSTAQIKTVLQAVNLLPLYEKLAKTAPEDSFLDQVSNWEEILSSGEQQRLAFARLLLNPPKMVILDEATSALDVENEHALYQQLRNLDLSYISVGHRPSLQAFHRHILTLEGEGKWSLRTT